MPIICIERVLVATADLDAACVNWTRAGFAVAPQRPLCEGLRFARLAAGAIAIDLCSAAKPRARGPLADYVAQAQAGGGGIVGWTWGEPAAGPPGQIPAPAEDHFTLPDFGQGSARATSCARGLAGVFTALIASEPDAGRRRRRLREACGGNRNSVEYLDHIVVMVPALEQAIAEQEAIGIQCRRIREAGNARHQAFFKLEQTVIEVVGPSPHSAGCWGLAFMCSDLDRAVAVARHEGLQATEPRAAVQGGRIARIVEPLDGVAVALMEAGAQPSTAG